MQANCIGMMMDCKRAAGQDRGKCWGSSLARAVGEGICLRGDTEGEHRETVGDRGRWEKTWGHRSCLCKGSGVSERGGGVEGGRAEGLQEGWTGESAGPQDATPVSPYSSSPGES